MTDDYLEKEMVIKEIDVKGIMTKSNLPVADFSVQRELYGDISG